MEEGAASGAEAGEPPGLAAVDGAAACAGAAEAVGAPEGVTWAVPCGAGVIVIVRPSLLKLANNAPCPVTAISADPLLS